jgi:hypothetical protein
MNTPSTKDLTSHDAICDAMGVPRTTSDGTLAHNLGTTAEDVMCCINDWRAELIDRAGNLRQSGRVKL